MKRDNIEERLIKLKTLLDQGILNKEEFEQQKKKILEE
ncbi:SHOCT domain-containing protein [Bacteroides xylanisolvens]